MSATPRQSDLKPYADYWGKAFSRIHLLPFHGLDVAAVAEAWFKVHPDFRAQLATWTGTPFETLEPWLLWAIALHDLGKFSVSFQAQVPWAYEQLRRVPPPPLQSGVRHDAAGCTAFGEWVQPLISDQTLDQGWGDSPIESWVPLLLASFQHHGKPIPETGSLRGTPLRAAFRTEDQDALITYAKDLKALLELPQSPPILGRETIRASCWFAGLVVLSDWIGSQESWFPPEATFETLDSYWARARDRAARALAESGVRPCRGSGHLGFTDLFPHLARNAPTPLQVLAGHLPLPAGPSLAILESLTGDGKTEAAMRLVHRMLAEGRVDGFYFALPTMATANAMYDRLRLTFPRLFQDPAQASLVLAHSARNLVEAFRDSIIPAVESRDDPSREEASAEARCQAWLADRGKKALLAQGGVGTLDQALLAVLQAKHQSLRLLGLYRKVLVVDEVHAYDPYMHQTLQELLRFHAAAGGSAILLSATLPFRMRQALVEAFAAGADLQRKALGSSAYPLATVLNSEGVQEIPVAVSPEKHRSILVHRLDSEEAVVARVLEAESRGQCACWIRNTVSGAVEAFRRLSSAMQEPSRLALFHARCALGDRLDREREIIRWFGRHSTETARTGRILVATQVVEQSLDLDFDVLVTDPAPIDLLLQRSGRLCRHPRDGRGNPLPPGAADGRAEPCLNILAPNPVDDASENWMDALSRGTTLVYPDPAALWRSLRALVRAHHFRLPQDARQLIEAVYGSDPEPAPEALRKREGTARGKGQAERAVARQNTLDLATGFQALGATWLPDAVVPTRLGDPSATFRLAKWDGTTLLPWRDKEPAFSWEMSEIRVRKAQAEAPYFEGDGPLTKAVEVVNATLPDRGRWTQVLPLQQMDNDGPWLGKVVDGKGKVHKIQYDPEIGLEFVKGA